MFEAIKIFMMNLFSQPTPGEVVTEGTLIVEKEMLEENKPVIKPRAKKLSAAKTTENVAAVSKVKVPRKPRTKKLPVDVPVTTEPLKPKTPRKPRAVKK